MLVGLRKGRIEAAAEDVEETLESDGIRRTDSPWIALAHNTGDSRIYLASRRGISGWVRAESVAALADKIRQLAA